MNLWRLPLTPTLSSQAGRGRSGSPLQPKLITLPLDCFAQTARPLLQLSEPSFAEKATGKVEFRETTDIEKGLTQSFPQADSALIPKAVVSSWVSFSRLHTRQPHARSPGRSPAANGFSVFSTNDRCHRSIVDVWLARNACPGAGCHKQGQFAGSRRVPRACHAGKQGRHTRSPPDRASRRGQARYGRYSGQELPALRL